MKTLKVTRRICGALAGATLVGVLATPSTAQASDKEWATAGKILAGVAVAVIEGERVTLMALGPAGTEIFRVEDDGKTVNVTAPSEDWRPWLERLPLARDIRLVHAWSCPQGRCAAGRGVVEESISEDGLAIERSWRGPGGRVSASIWDGRAEVTDDRRGYTVTLASRELRGPRAR